MMWGVFVKGNPEPLWLFKNSDLAMLMAYATKLTRVGGETAEAKEIRTSLGPISICKHCDEQIVKSTWREDGWVHLGPSWHVFCSAYPLLSAEPKAMDRCR